MVATPKKIRPITPAAPTSPDQPIAQLMPIVLRWEPLPDDYPIPDDPVDNIHQPLLAAALTDALRTANCLPTQALTPTNYPLCVTYNDAIVIKAPDWAYIPAISVERQAVDRSYTPNLQGELPTIVLEFISETEGGEYSIKPTTPIGKWFFYERILKVPIYGIFVPDRGLLELYRLTEDKYDLEIPDENGRHWIAELNLFLGPWRGDLGTERSGYWLRWWDAAGNLLLWGHEKAEQESQRADQASQRADQASQRAEQESQRADAAQLKAERLAERLRQQGIDPDEVV
jgi:Putative restriction endonuclease